MRLLFGCLLSGCFASLFTLWITQGSPSAAKSIYAEGKNPYQTLPAPENPYAKSFTGENVFPFHKTAEQTNLLQRPLEAASPELMTVDEQVGVRVYEMNKKSVVNINTKSTKIDVFLLTEQTSEGSGSGVVLDKSGHILTNFHVVENAIKTTGQVTITLYNGKSYDASYVGADPINDLAVMKIEADSTSLFPTKFGDSSRLKVGMRVFAIGNPFGLERTMTSGIISSLNRSIPLRENRSVRSIIQIDASVNPGNSGGPLLDAHGRLIGINAAIATGSREVSQSSGVGFAIPVNLVRRVSSELIKHGRFIRPDSGIRRVYETEQGLLIAQLDPEGPAAEAGLRGPRIERRRRGPFTIERVDRSSADLILKVDTQDVKSADDFLAYVEGKQFGETVILTILREGREIKIPLVLRKGE